jgi:voltage-gated potassium channel
VTRGSVSLRQAFVALGAFVALVLIGSVGFVFVNDESFFNSLYRSVNTIYTAGLEEAPRSSGAKAFTLVLIVGGVAIFLYVFGLVIELTVSGTVTGAWEQRRIRRRVDRLKDHYIICGYGRVGRRVAAEFRAARVPYVVVDFTKEAIEAAREHGDLIIEGRGTDDEDMAAAGLAHARGLVASSDSDVDNLFMTLSARALREDLLIVARAADVDSGRKLELAGADRVVQPYSTAGVEMAQLALKPQVAAFLDIVSSHGGPDLRFEEIEVTAGSRKLGRTIRDLRVRHETGALIVALRHRDGTFDTTPNPDTALREGDVMIAVGSPDELRKLEEMFAVSEEAVAG